MDVFKFDLALILVAIAGGALWIEQDHRVVIDAPAADAALVAGAACPENDTVPYSASCLDYLNVLAEAAPRLQVTAVREVPVAAPCPDNDRVPYSPSCIAFLKGATETGMRWRVTDSPASIPAPQ